MTSATGRRTGGGPRSPLVCIPSNDLVQTGHCPAKDRELDKPGQAAETANAGAPRMTGRIV
jgi:hypothetical protein